MMGHGRGLSRAVSLLEQQEWQVTYRTTKTPADATAWAREAVGASYDVVIAAGGDGTVGQVADGLAGTDVALGILPVGSGNVLARDLGLSRVGTLNPFALESAAQLLLDSEPRRVDLGWANGRHFFNWAGVGFGAEITREVEGQPGVKRRLGIVGTIVFAFMTLSTYAGTRATVRIDGRLVSRRLILAVVSNIQLYGRYFQIAPRALLDDGLLDVSCFHGQGALTTLYHVITVLLRRHVGDPRVSYYQAREVMIDTSRPLSVELDGEPFGTTPLLIRVVPKALTLLLPPSLAEDRFVGLDGVGRKGPQSRPWLTEARRSIFEVRRRMEETRSRVQELGRGRQEAAVDDTGVRGGQPADGDDPAEAASRERNSEGERLGT
jgi:YegS/Rv2252/BmrU family lipid kinase